MARVLLGCYELKDNKVTKLVFDKCYEKFKDKLFGGSTYNEAYSKWSEIKQMILDGKDKAVKKQDDMSYVIKTLEKNYYIVFGIGNGKKETLETIPGVYMPNQKRKLKKQTKIFLGRLPSLSFLPSA